MIEEQIKALIMQYDDLVRYRKKLLDCNLAETLLSVIPICVKNQDKLEVHLNEKIDECKRIKIRLKTARYKVSKLYAKYKENTEVKEFLDFAIFLSTVGDSSEEINALSNSEDCDLLLLHDTSLKDYFTDKVINNENSELEAQDFLSDEEAFDDDDVFSLISKLNAEKFQREYFESERDKLDHFADKLCYLLYKYLRRVGVFDEKNETNGTNAQTSNHPLKIDEDMQIKNRIHSVVEYDYESSLSSPVNLPNDDISSPEKNDSDISLLKETEQDTAESGQTSDLPVESELRNRESVQSSNSLTNVSESPSPIIPSQPPSKTNNVFDIEFIDVNLSVDDCESTIEKSSTADELKTIAPSTVPVQPLVQYDNPVSMREPVSNRCAQFPIPRTTSVSAPLPTSTLLNYKTYKCRICGTSFLNKSVITKHLRLHNTKLNRVFHCEKCARSYQGRHGQCLMRCPVCDVHENSSPENEDELMSTSEDEADMEENDEPAQVESTPAPSENEITRERNDALPWAGNSGQCLPPNKGMPPNKGNIVQCDICGQSYSHMFQLDKHIWEKHIGDKTFKCDMCDQRFAFEYELKRHSVTHDSMKPFKCSFCEMRFQRSCNRTTHEKSVHLNLPVKKPTKIKPGYFQCAHCDKHCGIKRDLISHLFTKHFPEATKQFQCTRCSKSFATKYRLKRHTMLLHDIII